MTAADLLDEINTFLARSGVGMTETTFGRLSVNDGKFVGRLRGGSGITLATAEKVRAFIAKRAQPDPSAEPVAKPVAPRKPARAA